MIQTKAFFTIRIHPMKKQYSFNIYSLLGLLVAVYCIYFLLIKDDQLPCSIQAVLYGVNHVITHWHVLVVGLLPIYVACVIFGLAMVGLYLGSLLERLMGRLFGAPKKN